MCILAKAYSNGAWDQNVDIAYTFKENLNRLNDIAEGKEGFKYVKHFEFNRNTYKVLKETKQVLELEIVDPKKQYFAHMALLEKRQK